MRRNRRPTEEVSSKQSIRFVSKSEAGERDMYIRPYVHMLTEDLHLGVMPIYPSGSPRPVRVNVTPNDPRIQEMLRVSFPTHHGEPRDVTESVSDFIDEVVHVMAYYGTAYYELVYFSESKGAAETRFKLEAISHRNINAFGRFYWQYIPKQALQMMAFEDVKRRFIWLPRERIARFSLPRGLGGFDNVA
jgi:hypothetical protein